MCAVPGNDVIVIPFCDCMHLPAHEGGKPTGDPTLSWFTGEYDVLGQEQIYAEVAGHRKACRLVPELPGLEEPAA